MRLVICSPHIVCLRVRLIQVLFYTFFAKKKRVFFKFFRQKPNFYRTAPLFYHRLTVHPQAVYGASQLFASTCRSLIIASSMVSLSAAKYNPMPPAAVKSTKPRG